MKKAYWVLGAVLIVLIIAALALFYFNKGNSPNHEVNGNLVSKYPALNYYGINESSRLTAKSNMYQLWKNKSLTVGNANLTMVNEKYYCNGNEAQEILYETYSMGGYVEGGWYSVNVLDCKDYYWIFYFGDSGPEMYGPYNFS